MMTRRMQWIAALAAVLATALVYAPGFGGYWVGDDFPNLHRVYAQSQQGTLWAETMAYFFSPVPSQGSFYRPMMMLSLALNYQFSGAHYGGWYGLNYAVHLANTLMVVLLAARLANVCALKTTWTAGLAGLFFGLSPLLAEGVYWISARSDGWVTLLSLTGVYLWSSGPPRGRWALMLPVLLVLALGFKESAAVLPLQVLLLALAWPAALTRAQRAALIASLVIAGLYLAWRAWLFGNAWQVYDPVAKVGLPEKFLQAMSTLPAWWQALAADSPQWGPPLLVLSALALVLATAAATHAKHPLRIVLALLCASGGLVLATLLNLGGMSGLGEGGRLLYGPMAWLSLALGVAAAEMRTDTLFNRPSRWRARLRAGYLGVLMACVVCAAFMLQALLQHAWSVQDNLRQLVAAIPDWSERHPGLTMLLVEENDGAFVFARNAQGGIVLPPLQSQGYLHRVLPGLPAESPLRRDQFCHGYATRLVELMPQVADAAMLKALNEPAAASWPATLACWSMREKRIVEVDTPTAPMTCAGWLEAAQRSLARCGN